MESMTLSSAQFEVNLVHNGPAVVTAKFSIVSDASGVTYNRTPEVGILPPQVSYQFIKNLIERAEVPLVQLVDSPSWVFDTFSGIIGDPADYHRRNEAVLAHWNTKFQIAAM